MFRDQCWNCKKTVLGLRTLCPHCGKPFSRMRMAVYRFYLIVAVLLLAGSAVAVLVKLLGSN